MRIVGALSRFWWMRGHTKEGLHWATTILQHYETFFAASPSSSAPMSTPSPASTTSPQHIQLLSKLHQTLGSLYYSQGTFHSAIHHHSQSIYLLRLLQDDHHRHTIAVLSNALGTFYREIGDYDKARELHGDSLKVFDEEGDAWGQALALSNLGVIGFLKGEAETSEKFHHRALEIREKIADALGELA